jgi:phenylpropionate dioxygenase-like ring-hydroxylating dioxygenase large terminal subunit
MNAPNTHPLIPLQGAVSMTQLELAKARHLPGEFYTSPQIAALEKDRIWMTHWLCVGREEELAKPGDFFTLRVAGEPIVLSRESDSSIVAFMNLCLHRGVEVASGRGNCKEFSCPYHAWLYDSGGNLVVAPHMKKSAVNLQGRRLRRLHSRLWRGWIFVNFADSPAVSFEDFIAPYERELTWFRSERCRLADKLVFEIPCNWKFMVENLMDIYHVDVLHAPTFGKTHKKNKDTIAHRSLPMGGWVLDLDSAPLAKDGKQLFVPLPWLEAASSGFNQKAGVFPNVNISVRYDSVRVWQLWPLGVDKTVMHVYLLFPEMTLGLPDFQESMTQYKDYIAKIVGEDASMVVSLQSNAGSRFFDPGPMSHLEGAIHHTLQYYLETMGA